MTQNRPGGSRRTVTPDTTDRSLVFYYRAGNRGLLVIYREYARSNGCADLS